MKQFYDTNTFFFIFTILIWELTKLTILANTPIYFE